MKSTTLLTLSGICRVRAGDIRFNSQSLNHLRPDEIVARGICHVPEGRQIFADLTVLENLKSHSAKKGWIQGYTDVRILMTAIFFEFQVGVGDFS